MDDKELVQIVNGCKAGSGESFSQLVDLYSGRCFGYFYRLTGNRAVSEDLLSKLFVKLVEKIDSYKGGVFEGWLFKVASNIFHDYLRGKQRRMKMLEVRKSQMELRASEVRESNSEEVDQLQIELGCMDADIRELIMMRFYSGLSFKEMAEIRAEPIGTTLSKLHRGLAKLRESMGR